MLIIFLFTIVLGKLFYLQLFNSKELQIKAIDQWARDIPLIGERGDIFDVNGIQLADTATTYSIFVRPNSVLDKGSVAQILASILGLNKTTIYKKINSKVSEVTISKKASSEQINLIYAQDVTGVYYSQNVERKYIYGDFLSTLLGFINIDGEGQTGVEAYYNKYLKGTNGYILTETDLVGREIEDGKTYYVQGSKGANLYLTIDYAIQSFVENAVKKAYVAHGATSASCIVMKVKTGEIVALAQAPSFDLNNVPRNDLSTVLNVSKNVLVSNVYEPGSTFKVLTSAIGIEEGVVSLDNTHCYCPGYRIVDGTKIKCWKTIGHGSQTFVEAVENSCNCMFMDIAQKLGTEKFYNGLKNFGITEKTGIDVSGEGKGLMIEESAVKNVDLARIGFGQAVAVTAIELITACNAVINGGYLITPYIVDKIINNEGEIVYKGEKSVNKQVISEETSKIMREILESVVANGGGKNAQVEGYRIGGKTGTAQKYSTSGGIAQGKYVATFMGFAPADNPEYIMLFIVDEPSTGVYYGSMVSAPMASEIFNQIFNYKGWQPIDDKQKTMIEMPNLRGLTITQVSAELKKIGLLYEYDGEIGNGETVKKQIPVEGSYINSESTVYVSFE